LIEVKAAAASHPTNAQMTGRTPASGRQASGLRHREASMKAIQESRFAGTLRAGVLAGIAGGLAEIAWIALYSASTGVPAEPVVRGIVFTLVPALAESSWSIPLGVLIHLGLALALGVGLAIAFGKFAGRSAFVFSEFGLTMVTLTAVWAVNFLIVLPYLNPEFVRLLPYEITLLSKLLFGLSAAAVLRTTATGSHKRGA
jgi:hypothetical protein